MLVNATRWEKIMVIFYFVLIWNKKLCMESDKNQELSVIKKSLFNFPLMQKLLMINCLNNNNNNNINKKYLNWLTNYLLVILLNLYLVLIVFSGLLMGKDAAIE